MKLSRAIRDFEQWGRGHKAERTVDLYTGLLKRFLRFIGDIDIKKIKPNDIEKYIRHLKTLNYADSSRAYMIISLRVLFKYLFRRRLINWDYELIEIPRFAHKHFPTVRTDEAVAMMKRVQVTDFKGLRDLTTLRFFYATGVRASEMAKNVTVDRLDTDKREAVINTMKSLEERLIVWDPETNQILIKYLEEREKWAKDECLIISLSRGRFGYGVTPRTLDRIVAKYRIPGGKTVPHSFRSGLATDMLEHEVDLPTIQAKLGHSSIYSLGPYTRVTNPHLKRQYNRVRK